MIYPNLEAMTDAERLAWAQAERSHAASWAEKADMIGGNGSTVGRAEREFEFVDYLIANGGALPPRSTMPTVGDCAHCGEDGVELTKSEKTNDQAVCGDCAKILTAQWHEDNGAYGVGS